MTAADIQRLKDLLPTTMGSEEIRETYAREILQRSIFSARMASVPYLAKLREVLVGISSGAINQAGARGELIPLLEQMGHSMQDGGGLANPIAPTRLNLIIDTNRQMAASASRIASQTPGVLHQYPAWELTRLVDKSQPRPDWPARWRHAGQSCGFEGALQDRFIALKSSPIWQHLGDGAGGFKDTLGNPYPPFAFNSGLAWVGVDRAECIRLGLIAGDEEVAAPKAADLSPSQREIAEAADRCGFSIEDLEAGLA